MIPKLDEYKNRWEIVSDQAIKPGLEAIEKALAKLGNPEKDLKVFHVAGTNGKGSTIAFIESILRKQGYSTGVFSSPAIIDIHDQIRINGTAISEEQLHLSFKELKKAGLSNSLTDFELLTAAAFCTFRRLAPDYALIETGMGGLFDSTNVVSPLVSVITSIAIEHSPFLGTTVAEIAEHKAGIIKPGIPVVVGPLEREALTVVQSRAFDCKSDVLVYGDDFTMDAGKRETFNGIETIPKLVRGMKGPHQGINAALAIEALLKSSVKIDHEAIVEGISTANLAHRFDEIYPNVFVDGAHNPAAAEALAKTIQFEFPGEKVDFYIGMLKGKDSKRVIDALVPVANSFTFMTFSHPQAERAEVLLDNCNFEVKNVTKSKSDTIILDKGNESKKIVTGSLYLLEGLKFCIK